MKMDIVSTLRLHEIIGNKPHLVIGDIHGFFDHVIGLIDTCNTKPEFIICVGDLTDRGPSSDKVLQWAMDTPNVYSVLGNHDHKLSRMLMGNPVKLTHGLDVTKEQISHMDHEKISEFIKRMPNIITIPMIDNKPTYVLHAGIDPKKAIWDQQIATTIFARSSNFTQYNSGDGTNWYDAFGDDMNIIFGHVYHADPKPRENLWALDSHVFDTGILRGLFVQDGKREILEFNS